MRVEVLRHKWAVLGMVAALFATGCATIPPPPGEEIPEGWPDYSSWDDNERSRPPLSPHSIAWPSTAAPDAQGNVIPEMMTLRVPSSSHSVRVKLPRVSSSVASASITTRLSRAS